LVPDFTDGGVTQRWPKKNSVRSGWASKVMFARVAKRPNREKEMKATFEIKKAADGRFVFNLKAGNDQVILTSQAYESKESAEGGIASVKQNATIDGRYEEKTGTDGLPYFVLHAANQQVIGRSQMYSSREAMHKGIASVKQCAPSAGTVDLSAHVHSAGGEVSHSRS
jgi:uncharacterized protein YegP (UPF0339 family)